MIIVQPEENDDVYITSEQPGKGKYESLKKRLKTEDGQTTVSRNNTNGKDTIITCFVIRVLNKIDTVDTIYGKNRNRLGIHLLINIIIITRGILLAAFIRRSCGKTHLH